MTKLPILERFQEQENLLGGPLAIMSDGTRVEFPEGMQVRFRAAAEFIVDQYKLTVRRGDRQYGLILLAGADIYRVEMAKRELERIMQVEA